MNRLSTGSPPGAHTLSRGVAEVLLSRYKMPITSESESKQYPLAMLAGVAVVLLILGGFYFLTRQGPSPSVTAAPPLPFGDAEQAYAAKIHFSNPQMSRAANMLNQEVTFIVGTVENSGTRVALQ